MDLAPETPFLYAGLAVLALALILASRYRLRRAVAVLGLAGLAGVAVFLWMRRDAVGLAGMGLALVAVALGRRQGARPAVPAPRRSGRSRDCEESNDAPGTRPAGRHQL